MRSDAVKQLLRDESIPFSLAVLRDEGSELLGLYQSLVDLFDEYAVDLQWRYYRDVKAWLCKASKGSRTICWISAWQRFFKISFYIPEKHRESLLSIDLLNDVLLSVKTQKQKGKSFSVVIDYSGMNQLVVLDQLVVFKLGIR